jgi:predicted acylesterase/phospholipase RssA
LTRANGLPPRRTVLRLAVAMRGGVSLAVWIGGALCEIDRLQQRSSDRFIKDLLDLTIFSRAEVDILTGTSAGGLNAALGGFAIASGRELDELRDLWISAADIDRLLASSGSNRQRSILDGDYFYQQVKNRLEDLARPGHGTSRPIEFFLAATLFGGVQVSERVDPLFSDRRSDALFHFRHLARHAAFSDLIDSNAPSRVATAARSSASFPAAFEPVEVGTAMFRGELSLPRTSRTPDAVRLLDGGIVDNIPVARAIQAASMAPATELVRRWIVFLHPSPDELGARRKRPDPGDTPSMPAVGFDLLSGVNAETLLDDLAFLERHNREAESQALSRYSLCERAMSDPVTYAVGSSLASVDCDCIYELLDDPQSMLGWLPIGADPPPSPIRAFDDDARFDLRMALLNGLLRRPDTIRPFSRVVRLAHFTIEWIRWAEHHVSHDFAAQRRSVYDVLFAATLIDAAVARRALAADTDHLKALEAALETAEHNPALRKLAQTLGPSAGRDTEPLIDRVGATHRQTLESLARGELPPTAETTSGGGVSHLLLEHLVKVGEVVLKETENVRDAPKSLFTLLGGAFGMSRPPRHLPKSAFTLFERLFGMSRRHPPLRFLLLALDHATAGLHRGRAAPTPQSIDYLRVSGAAGSPLAGPPVPLDPVPHLEHIRVSEEGRIDPHDKLSGNRLSNFSAFISRRFRANDWMWGRMDAATEMVNLLIRSEYLGPGSARQRAARLEQLVTSPFNEAAVAPDTYVCAAEAVCRAMWSQHAPGIESELAEAGPRSNPEILTLTRRVVLTRWHLEIMVEEIPKLNAQPLEPGDTLVHEEPFNAPPAGAFPEEQSKRRLEGLLRSYERRPRRVGDIWGRRKTTALGVRFARQTARGLVPDPGVGSAVKRIAIAAPLFMAVAALLSRGAFLIAWNALVGVVLLPRLRPTARLALAAVSLALSFLFWFKFVRRRREPFYGLGSAFRASASGLVSLALLAAGLVGTWWHAWIVRAPDHFPSTSRASLPWTGLLNRGGVLWPSIIVASASALAVICLWVWAKPWKIGIGAGIAGLVMGFWSVLGAWQGPKNPSGLQTAVAGAGSMWIPAVVLALGFTAVAVLRQPEDRPEAS